MTDKPKEVTTSQGLKVPCDCNVLLFEAANWNIKYNLTQHEVEGHDADGEASSDVQNALNNFVEFEALATQCKCLPEKKELLKKFYNEEAEE